MLCRHHFLNVTCQCCVSSNIPHLGMKCLTPFWALGSHLTILTEKGFYQKVKMRLSLYQGKQTLCYDLMRGLKTEINSSFALILAWFSVYILQSGGKFFFFLIMLSSRLFYSKEYSLEDFFRKTKLIKTIGFMRVLGIVAQM